MALKKAAAKKVSKKVARKVAKSKAKRVKVSQPASAKAVKTAAKTTKTKRTSAPTMSINFHEGTDMAIAFAEILKGGTSRSDVSQRLAKIWENTKTRNGNSKPVSTIMNHVVRRAKANGYRIEQSWRLVKDDGTTPDVDTAQAIEEGSVDVPEGNTPAPKKAVKKTRSIKTSKKAVKRRTGA